MNTKMVALLGLSAIGLAACTDAGPTPNAGVQSTATLDCDAAIKPKASVGIALTQDGIKPRANVGLVVDLTKIGKSQDTLEDCAQSGIKTGATASVGVSVGG